MQISKIDLDDNKPTSGGKTKLAPEPKFTTEISSPSKSPIKIPVALYFIPVILLGLFAGYMLKINTGPKSTMITSVNGAPIQSAVPSAGAKVGDIFGSGDEKAFRDKVEGVLDKGGINGEGTHQIVRPGGKSQTVYITSSVIDLDNLVGHKVTVWGETFKGKAAGWIMDVGRARIDELNAPLPK